METRSRRRRIDLEHQTKRMGKVKVLMERLTKKELQAHGVNSCRSQKHPQKKIDNIRNASETKSNTQEPEENTSKNSQQISQVQMLNDAKQTQKATQISRSPKKYSLRSGSNKRPRDERDDIQSETKLNMTLRNKKNDVRSETKSITRESVKKKSKNSKQMLQERMLSDAPEKEFLSNEIVLASIPGYAPWPARILQISGQTITIAFFGTGQMYDNTIYI